MLCRLIDIEPVQEDLTVAIPGFLEMWVVLQGVENAHTSFSAVYTGPCLHMRTIESHKSHSIISGNIVRLIMDHLRCFLVVLMDGATMQERNDYLLQLIYEHTKQ